MKFALPSPGLACFDMGGVLHHARYLELLEKGREIFFEKLGLPYSQLVEQGFHLALTKAEQEFLKPIYYAETLQLEIELEEVRSRKLDVLHKIYSDENLVHRCRTSHLSVKKTTKGFNPASLPQDFLDSLQQSIKS